MFILSAVLLVVFAVSATLYSVVIAASLLTEKADGSSQKDTFSRLTGPYDRATLEKVIQPRFHKPAVVLLYTRNWSFILFVTIYLMESLLRLFV